LDRSVTIAASLEEQLNIQPYNATQGPARDVADRWLQVGREQLAEGDYERAIAAWQEAAAIYEALGDNEAAGQAYSAIGATYAQLGDYIQAEQAIRRRIAAARDSNNSIGASYGLNNLGTLYLNRGRLEPAQELFAEALQLAQAADDRRTIGLSLSNLALVAVQVNDFDTAVEFLEAATNYRYLAGDYIGEANSSNTLGDVYVALGRDSNAIGAYRIALRAGADADDRALQLRALDGLLGIYFEREDWRAVRDYLNRRAALTLEDDVALDSQAAVTLRWLGDYSLAQGQAATAKGFYSQALGVARSFDNTPLETELTNRILRL
jgi:tetratricopeptide (TPR) repeat protein